MGIIATFDLPGNRMPVTRHLDPAVPITFRLQQVVPTGTVTPMFWAKCAAPSVACPQLEAALRADDNVVDHSVLEDGGNQKLFLVTWTGDGDDGAISLLDSGDGIVLSAVGTPRAWTVEMLFPTRTALGSFVHRARTENVLLHLDSLRTSTDAGAETGLTDRQREVLLAAYDVGYFEVPRRGTAEDVARELGISAQTVSEHLRRAAKHLVEETVLGGRPRVSETTSRSGTTTQTRTTTSRNS